MIGERLRAEWRLKCLLMAGLNLWVYLPYHWLQHHQFFTPTVMPAGFLDRLISFNDDAVWLYLSIYLLMPLGPFLMSRRSDLCRYAAGIVLIGLVADLIFVFFPTICPRPLAGAATPLYRLVTDIDNPLHAFPSLHAAFAVFSSRCAVRVLHEMSAPRGWTGVIWVWVGLILWATLATKQHVAADLVAGSVLGFGIHFWVFNERKHKAKATPAMRTTITRQTPA